VSEKLQEIEKVFAQGRASEALDLLEAFLAEEPENIRALNDLGAILQSLGRAEASEEAFRRALELDPASRVSRNNLALALAAREKWDEARREIQTLLAENQNEAHLWIWLAKIEMTANRKKEALEYIEKALTLDSGNLELKTAKEKLLQELESPGLKAEAQGESVLMCCQKSLEYFALQLCDELEKSLVVRRMVSGSFGAFHWPLKSASTIWLEWGSDLSIEATRQAELLRGKKVIVRLHSFDILNRQAGQVNYDLVTDVVFVCHYMRDLFQRLAPDRLNNVRVHVIHNGIQLERFPFKGGRGRKKIAFVGRLEAKKDPMLMVQAFHFLLSRHPELELHVAGAPDNNRFYLSIPDFLAKNKLERSTHFYGHVEDIPAWLADKDYIFCTSPIESQGVGLLEAMHSGLRPLIYDFPGAENLYPQNYLWRNLDELDRLLSEGPSPEDCRDFVAEKYSMARQAANWLKVIRGHEPVVEDMPVASISRKNA